MKGICRCSRCEWWRKGFGTPQRPRNYFTFKIGFFFLLALASAIALGWLIDDNLPSVNWEAIP